MQGCVLVALMLATHDARLPLSVHETETSCGIFQAERKGLSESGARRIVPGARVISLP